jgi:hypothetical protein
LSAQHDHLVAQRTGLAGMSEQFGGGLAFADLRVGQAPGDLHALGRGQQVELQPPVPAGMGGAVAIVRHPDSSERFTVCREVPHGTGVASSSRSPSDHDGLHLATMLARAS